ncbi:unnamed protein product [Sphenostylis stenocarpa]|uniref:Uncharacterized protein n=1 Tax=Sphenostylis stenocarpa TaxID=92480 RepID=A0AA86TD42_9FABA|nr:unnamed protein product [Sphenostylis stenocarpa]
MSSTSSSSSSSSSTSTPYDAVAPDIPGPSTRRTGQFEGPSSSRQRAMNEVLPEPFLEALANQLAIDTANYNGRLAAGPALAILFQFDQEFVTRVCLGLVFVGVDRTRDSVFGTRQALGHTFLGNESEMFAMSLFCDALVPDADDATSMPPRSLA